MNSTNELIIAPAVEPSRDITTGMPSTFKPVSYYGIANSHHFAMKSPMPQRRVAFGNMKKDSPVIAVRPFIQGECWKNNS